MGENLIDEFPPEIGETLFDIAENILQTKNVKVRIDAGSKKGMSVFSLSDCK